MGVRNDRGKKNTTENIKNVTEKCGFGNFEGSGLDNNCCEGGASCVLIPDFDLGDFKCEYISSNDFVANYPKRIKHKEENFDFSLYPDLFSLQYAFFSRLFSFGAYSKRRPTEFLYKLLKSLFPIRSIKDEFILDFVDYFIEPPKNSPEECLEKGISYSVSFTIKFRLISSDNVVEQDVYFGEIPYMTKYASFIYNGVERVGVMLMEKSTGISFTVKKKTEFSPCDCVCRVIPQNGVWVEFIVNQRMLMYVALNKKYKIPVSTFLRAFGYATEFEILNLFNLVDRVEFSSENELKKYIGRSLAYKIIKKKFTVDKKTTKKEDILFHQYTVLDESIVKKIVENGNNEILLLKRDQELINKYSILVNTLNADVVNDQNGAYLAIYGEYTDDKNMNDVAVAKKFFYNMFENNESFNLGYVGRNRINTIIGVKSYKTYVGLLTKTDIKFILSYYFAVINREKDAVDIDHYGNKQIKTVGEQMYEMLKTFFQNVARKAKDRMNISDKSDMNVYNLMAGNSFSSSINSFFATNNLLQFMDGINPLCEVMHKRRISFAGSGGIDENSASVDIRSIHYSQYGRVCPIETPEGHTIGIILSLAMCAKVDNSGFILAPYRLVRNGRIDFSDKGIVYLNATEELGKKIIPASVNFDKNWNIIDSVVKVRIGDNFKLVNRNEVDYMDLFYNEPFSVAASTIPFLECDDSSRALTGTNMLKQAVPLLQPEAPIVGTGVEKKICQDFRKVLYAEGDGVVKYVDSSRIVIDYKISDDDELCTYDDKVKEYNLVKFKGTNQKTCENYRPVVKIGDKVKKGDVLTEGFSTQNGELALGKNVVVAFMTCDGYNFQDSIVISDRLLKDDTFTSIYVETFTETAKNTKFGNEVIGDSPFFLDVEVARKLDDRGIVREGQYVKSGDILVAKSKPTSDVLVAKSKSNSENKNADPLLSLLAVLFGDKACKVKDCSLEVPPFVEGTVIDTRLYSRRDKKISSAVLKESLQSLKNKYNDELKIFTDTAIDKFVKLLKGVKSNKVIHKYGEILVKPGICFSRDVLETEVLKIGGDIDSISTSYPGLNYFTMLGDIICEDWTTNDSINTRVEKLIKNTLNKQFDILHRYYNDEYKVLHGDYLNDDVLKKAEVRIACKRKLQVGDKLSGRHGNKGVVSEIRRSEDMPFLKDGTTIDILLTPLGVPSRMNIGQVCETVLGLAGHVLGCKYQSPIFNGFDINSINDELGKAGVPDYGEMQLYDGLTGEKFDEKSTVGVTFFIKLNHMVEDKVHARSIGKYSAVTQQPLSGRANFGGQRFGEMEVWSLEAYGAAFLLQEMLTVKSDDRKGRNEIYDSLINGNSVSSSNSPESFFVLMSELMALGFKITLLD